MPVSDSIADLLARIRNAGSAKHKTLDTPFSNTKFAISQILKDQGYISNCEKIEEGVQGSIRITLRYYNREHAIVNIKRISKPGRRIYMPADRLPRVNNGLGTTIISTSHGVMSDKQARLQNLGGEVLCSVW
ncbi:MAG: 30S ribosomal protein S8 [Candidatus Kapabacteria bacterium]|nr:30S ribosomal protein S8 [Candidatus Kapabacteria bacterium]